MQLAHSGKGIVIVITVVFSCLSFTLGFFVGKFGNPRKTEAPSVSLEQAAPVKVETQPVQAPQTAEAPKIVPELTTAPIAPSQPQPANTEPHSRPATPPREVPSPERVPQERAPIVKQVKEVSKAEVAESRAESVESLYAVQLGAFRNKAEAEKIKAKYSRKGYKIHIDAVKADKKTKIYKLRTGEFKEKKDAEVLAVKLKKTENLKTFVVTFNR